MVIKRLNEHRGMATLYLAIGVVAALAIGSVTLQMLGNAKVRAQVRRLDATEGFYAAELAVLNTYERNKATPLPIVEVLPLGSEANTFIRRFKNNSLSTRVIDNVASNSFCGSFNTPNSNQQVCISALKPPLVTITANGVPVSTTIPYNGSATLRWTSQFATTCSLSSTAADLSGSPAIADPSILTSSPAIVRNNLLNTRTYSISCTGDGGTTTRSVMVIVPPAPVVHIFANGVNPLPGAPLPYCSQPLISWNSTGTTACTVTPTGWTGTSNPGVLSPKLTADTDFDISCTGGTASNRVRVRVTNGPSGGSVQGTVTVGFEDNGGGDAFCVPVGLPGCGDFDDAWVRYQSFAGLRKIGKAVYATSNMNVSVTTWRGTSGCAHQYVVQVLDGCGNLMSSQNVAEGVATTVALQKDQQVNSFVSRLLCPWGNFGVFWNQNSIWAVVN